MALSDKQKKFVKEYLVDFNATQAAIRAKYSAKTASEQASRLLTNVNIQFAVQEEQKKLSNRVEVTQEAVIAELAKIGFCNMRKAVKWGASLGEIVIGEDIVQTNGVQLIDSDDLDESTAAAISEISQTAQGIKIKFHDKQAALVNLGRHLGIFEIDNRQRNPLDEMSRESLKLLKEKLQKK